MADRRDDLDSWLSARIEPLPPPPGTFDLIKRRARRRKLARLAVTASAAAAVVAAAVTVPQVVNLTVTPGPTTGAAAAGHSSTAAPKPTSSTEASAASSVPGAPPGAVRTSFRPTSVTFVGRHTGWVLGQGSAPGQCASSCTSVARTNDAGTDWTDLSAPAAGVPDGATGVSQIRFLNTSDGWAFGPELFATHDGGHTWTRIGTHGLRVTGLETVGDRAFAIFASCKGTGLEFASRCTSLTLYSSPASADDWTQAGATTTGLAGGSAALVLTAARGYLIGPDGTLYAGPVNGTAAWPRAGRLPSGCDVGPAQLDGQPSGVMFGAVNAERLILACTSASAGQSGTGQPGQSGTGQPSSGQPSSGQSGAGQAGQQRKLIFSSADAGASWQPLPSAPQAGVAFSIAASPRDDVILGTDRGIELLRAGATTWQAATLAGGGPAGGFGFVGMTTAEQGIALPARPDAGTVWFTFDGGQTWRPSLVS
jgi:photosystem II stability/assembly factor-like uncharacterized protein